MNYIKKIFKNDKDEYISFPSTDDNITCENGQKLRDVLDNFTTDDLNSTTYSNLNTTNKTVIGSEGKSTQSEVYFLKKGESVNIFLEKNSLV